VGVRVREPELHQGGQAAELVRVGVGVRVRARVPVRVRVRVRVRVTVTVTVTVRDSVRPKPKPKPKRTPAPTSTRRPYLPLTWLGTVPDRKLPSRSRASRCCSAPNKG